MFDRFYYMEWDNAVVLVMALLTFFIAYSITDDAMKSSITTLAVVGTAYVILNHVM